jgi:hypothetical protein
MEHYGMNYRGDIVEHCADGGVGYEYQIIWRDGDRLYANDAGMNLLLRMINMLDQRYEMNGGAEKP